jgi:hypothetical protein
MQTPYIGIVFASVLALAVSFPAAAAQKVAGINKDYQRLSETTANVPDKPGHTLKQVTIVWKTVSANPEFGEAWTSGVATAGQHRDRQYGTGLRNQSFPKRRC